MPRTHLSETAAKKRIDALVAKRLTLKEKIRDEKKHVTGNETLLKQLKWENLILKDQIEEELRKAS